MRHAITIALLMCGMLAQAQNFTAAIPHVTTITGEPSASGSRLRFNLTNGRIYEWNPNSSAWFAIAQGIDTISGGSAPAYVPAYQQSPFVINSDNELYRYRAGSWHLLNGGGGGGGGTVSTDATLTGDGSVGDPLGIAQQSATTSEVLTWTGAAWEPSWGNPFIFVTTGQTITTAVNEILVGTIAGNITLGLPACDATTHEKHFKFVRNGTDAFFVKIDPNGSQTFYDGTTEKIQYGKLSIDCTCRFSGGTGVWFFDNF